MVGSDHDMEEAWARWLKRDRAPREEKSMWDRLTPEQHRVALCYITAFVVAVAIIVLCVATLG